jgi:formylglycine-generating enzyme required for sulfatase activity
MLISSDSHYMPPPPGQNENRWLISRRRLLQLAAAAAAGTVLQPLRSLATEGPGWFSPEPEIIGAPSDPALWPEYRRLLGAWREDKRRELGYSDALYRRQDFAWVGRCFACCFLMVCDELFLDHRAGRFTPGRFLDQGELEFGGYDAVVLWHAYPRVGLDERNQFDFYRDLPGGLRGLRGLSRHFQRRGVRVFIDYNPWDTQTRRETKGDLDALAELVQAVNADGIFLDTLDRGVAEFRRKLDAARPGVVLEGEGALPLANVHDHHLSWAQWFSDSAAPGVLRNKWFERRHLQHQIKRWDSDHTGELHTAWMNGSGMLVWENVFGTWLGWCQRDRSLLRAMLPIQRRYAGLFCGENWTPLVPTLKAEVFASLWGGGGLRLWTLINRSQAAVAGPLLPARLEPGQTVFDLVAGKPASPDFSTSIAARGLGCFVAGAPAALGADFKRFLRAQAAAQARASWDTAYPQRQTQLLAVKPTQKRPLAPEGMVEVPAAEINLVIDMRLRECGYYESVREKNPDFQDVYTHKTAPFRRRVRLTRFALDATPVTNAQFAAFLRATRWRPPHPANFLKHWLNGSPPPGKEDHPVVYVDLDDARAFARWAGKRLPTEEEWQYAAQGPQALKYPWGNELLPDRCNDGRGGGTTPVKAFPEGRSPFGCYDLCGNVWQWTESERTDGRTRFAILRGGCFYRRGGSLWYFDDGLHPANFAAKMLLNWAGLDRCATIGFRCALDLA